MSHDPFDTHGATTHERISLLFKEIEHTNKNINRLHKEVQHYREEDHRAHEGINEELEVIRQLSVSNQIVLKKYQGIGGFALWVVTSMGAAAFAVWEWVKYEG